MKMTSALLIFFGSLLVSAGVQATDGVTPGRIVIGQSITLQGGKNDYGTAVQAGVQTYITGVNERGGVNGRQIVLKTLDDDNKAAVAESNTRQLVEQDKVFILFGSIEGGPSTAVMKVANQLSVPFFGPMAGSPTLRRPLQPLVFPVRAEHRDEFRALMAQAKNLGMTRVGFLRSDSEVGGQHLANVKSLCLELGVELTADLPFGSTANEAQIDALVQRMETSGTQMVFNHGSSGVYETFIRKARSTGSRAVFYGVNSGSTQLVKHLGDLARGMVFTQVVPSPWERKTAITREYQDVFAHARPGEEFSYGSLEGYITAKALVMALKLAGPNPSREGFQKALEGAKLNLNGLRVSYESDFHQGLNFVDLSIVTRELKFRH